MSLKVLLLLAPCLVGQVSALPKWQGGGAIDPSFWTSFNITKSCSNNGTISLLSSKPVNLSSATLKWFRPQCAIGGTEVRVDAFLRSNNKGQLALGQFNCSNPDLIHDLNNTWTAFWYLLYPGVYTVCSRASPTDAWKNETQIVLLDAANETCSYILNPNSTAMCTSQQNGTTFRYSKQLQCDMSNVTAPMPFFDGFINNQTAVPRTSCVTSCADCRAKGGSCFGWEWKPVDPNAIQRVAVQVGKSVQQPPAIKRQGWRIPCQ